MDLRGKPLCYQKMNKTNIDEFIDNVADGQEINLWEGNSITPATML